MSELQTFEFQMSDAALQDAIVAAGRMVAECPPESPVHDDLCNHLRKLLGAQAYRAEVMLRGKTQEAA